MTDNMNVTIVKDSEPEAESLKIVKSKGKIVGSLRVFMIKDGDFLVAYMPALNLSAYGKDEAEPHKMLSDVLDDYFESLIKLKKDQVITELSKYGWQKSFFNKQFNNTSYIDKNGVLKNFELPKDTPIEESRMKVT